MPTFFLQPYTLRQNTHYSKLITSSFIKNKLYICNFFYNHKKKEKRKKKLNQSREGKKERGRNIQSNIIVQNQISKTHDDRYDSYECIRSQN